MSFNFGTPQAQQNAPAFNFATPPAGGTSGSSFAFGGPTTSSAPTATVQPLSAPAFGYLGSTTTAPSSAPSFGFGTPTPNTATVAPLSFGASVPSTSFGGVVQPTLGLAQPLGLASTGSATVGFAGLGQSTATMTPSTLGGGLSFGAAATSKPSSSLFGSGGLGQSSIAATSGIPSFGQPSATSASAFGLPAATSASAFGLGAATSTPGALSFGGLPPTATAAPSFALGGVSSTIANTACLGLGGTGSTALTVSQSKPTSVGLGGTLSAFGNSPANSAANDPKSGSANNIKDTPIPNELLETVEEFKKFVKEERSTSSDIAHVSPKIHNKIAEEISGMNRLVSGLVSGLSRNCSILDMIKREAAQEILNAEVGQRTRDTPPGLQYENIGPYEYFGRLLSNFESQMLHYRRQIEETEQHLQSMANGQALTPEDVARALQKLHTAFVGLAGQYQTVHEAVRGQAEAFVQWHR
jgi:nucleoporin p58/p45